MSGEGDTGLAGVVRVGLDAVRWSSWPALLRIGVLGLAGVVLLFIAVGQWGPGWKTLFSPAAPEASTQPVSAPAPVAAKQPSADGWKPPTGHISETQSLGIGHGGSVNISGGEVGATPVIIDNSPVTAGNGPAGGGDVTLLGGRGGLTITNSSIKAGDAR